jgi:hypothetical protein
MCLALATVLVSIPTQSSQVNSSNYDGLLYYGSGGLSEPTPNYVVGTGIGQVMIGDTTDGYHNIAAQYGIFYLNITYTSATTLTLFSFRIEDFGIEWVKLNWTE